MNCPICNTDNLYRAEREGVEIDICTNCGGVWLDRGELETIINRVVCEDDLSTQRPTDRFDRFRRGYDGYFSG